MFGSSKGMSQIVLQNKTQLLMQGSIVYSNIQYLTHYYQICSSSQYLLHMKVHFLQRYSYSLTAKMVPYSHKISQQFIVLESHTTLTLTKMNTCMTSPIGFPLFSNRHFFQLTQDKKGLFKACKRA